MTIRAPGLAEAPQAQGEDPPRWSVQLLGRFQLGDGQRLHTRLPSRAVTALLARLVLWPQRDHAREELAELLWPGTDASTSRRRLRHTLSLLKDVLEPPENGPAPVIQADRQSLRVVPGTLQCDVHAFEGLVKAGQPAAALALYHGDLLPGYYEEWILDERQRLANLHEKAVERAALIPPSSPSRPGSTALQPDRGPRADDASWRDVAVAGAIGQRTAGGPQRTDRSTLPDFLTRYLGNADQLAQLAAKIRQHRWVTLLGPGGSGKTRLAVELARQMHAGHAPPNRAGADHPPASASGASAAHAGDDAAQFDRVVFVPLVSALQRQQVLDAVARALRIDVSNPTADALIARLAGWKTLLVLDNVEQLVGIADDLLLQLTAALPALHLLLTSRRSLGVEGERQFAIAPLAMPAAGASVRAVASSAAVALFVDRASAVRADFHVSPRNHAVLAALVAALEGMPLAIELAASRLRSVSPADMLERLGPGTAVPGHTPRLDLLARPSERSAADPRHASMLRTIEWSWRQLDTAQRELAGAMTVFGGGCSLGMLQHVSGGGAGVMRVLDELLSHSLAQERSAQTGAEGGAESALDSESRRFQLYEPIREYATTQFSAAQAAHWRARHREWAIAWARALPLTPSLAEVRAQLPNIATALHSAVTDDAGDDAVRLLLALHHSLEDVELPLAALSHASAAVDTCRDEALRSRGHTAIVPLLFAAGQKEAAQRHVEAVLRQLPEDPVQRSRAIFAAARLRWRSDLQHPERVLPMIGEAQLLAEAAGDHYLIASLLSLRAFATHVQEGTPHAALALQRQALAHWQAYGNRHAVNLGRYNLAVFEFHAGHAAVALAEFEALAAEAAVLQDWRRLATANDACGSVLCALRRWPEAVQAYRDGLALAWNTVSIYTLAYVFWNIPRALAHARQPALALSLAAFSEGFYVERVGPMTPTDRRDLLRVRRLAARQLGPRECAEAWARGMLLTLADAVALALQD